VVVTGACADKVPTPETKAKAKLAAIFFLNFE
jgi:hypothetical protein